MHDLTLIPFTCTSVETFKSYLELTASQERYKLELHLAKLHRSSPQFVLPGYCNVCNETTDFFVSTSAAAENGAVVSMPDWREQLVCPRCGLNNRQRLVAALVFGRIHEIRHDGCGSSVTVYLTEQVTSLYRAVATAVGADNVIGSEYIDPSHLPGLMKNGVRHEDVQRLSFPAESFDLVVSCEVFEHIPDPDIALSEVHRVLRPSGELILTVPFFALRAQSIRRAGIEAGSLRYYFPEEFHGNPMSPSGSLVFTEFAWDILDRMSAVGFAEPTVNYYWSLEYGHLSITNPIFRCRKLAGCRA